MGHIRGLSGAWAKGPPRTSGESLEQHSADEPKPTDSTTQNVAPSVVVPLHPPELGSIFWTARPRATVTATDKLYLNASKSPNRNRKRRPWVVVEVVSEDEVIMMYDLSSLKRSCFGGGVSDFRTNLNFVQLIGHPQPKFREGGRPSLRPLRSSFFRLPQHQRGLGDLSLSSNMTMVGDSPESAYCISAWKFWYSVRLSKGKRVWAN